MATGMNNNERKKAAMSQPHTNETSASSYTGTLTFDLVPEILCRVPVKSLMQLRCVCKSWNSLISDHKFAKKHLTWSRTQLNRHHFLLLGRDRKSVVVKVLVGDTQLSSFFNSTSTSIPGTRLSYPLNDEIPDDMLIGSCDGILCFAIGYYDPSLMVWNPSIRKFKILPPLEYQWQLNGTIYGFGYDSLTDTYKVVVVQCYEWNSFGKVCKIKVMLHTLGNDTWKTVEGFPSSLRGDIPLSERAKFVSGAINWLVRVRVPTNSSSSRVIRSLDLGNESFQEYLPPDYGEVCDLTLGVLRDCLCILAHTDTLVIHVWIMKDYGNKDSWTKLFSVPYKELLGCQVPASAYPLYISEDDQLLLDFEMKLAVYNSRDGTGKTPEVQSIFGDYCDWYDNHVYIESLIAPLP